MENKLYRLVFLTVLIFFAVGVQAQRRNARYVEYINKNIKNNINIKFLIIFFIPLFLNIYSPPIFNFYIINLPSTHFFNHFYIDFFFC